MEETADFTRFTIVNFNFRPLVKHIDDRLKEDADSIRDFFYPVPDAALTFAHLEGHHFKINLEFNKDFSYEPARFGRWLTTCRRWEKNIGRIRAFYKVTRAERSAGLPPLIRSFDFDTHESGHILFLARALQEKLAPPLDASLVDGGMDINAMWYSNSTSLDRVDVWDGAPRDVLAPKREAANDQGAIGHADQENYELDRPIKRDRPEIKAEVEVKVEDGLVRQAPVPFGNVTQAPSPTENGLNFRPLLPPG